MDNFITTTNDELSCCEVPSSNIENENHNIENENQNLTDCVVDKLPILSFTNEKGNVRVKERKLLREGILGQLNAVFASHPHKKQKNVNGGFSLCLGVDALTGKNIWAHIELTVNDKEPNIYSGRAKIEVEIPQLF